MRLVLVLWLACVRPSAPDDPVEVRAIPPHGALAHGARDALIHGDLAGTREDAAGLAAGLRKADLAPEATAARDATVTAAEALAAAPDAVAAAPALGRLVLTCSGCHEGRAPVEPVPPPSTGDGVRAEMQRHDRAMLGIWAGLVAGDADAVRTHGKALSETVIAPVEGATPAVAALDDAVSTAALALASADPPDRAARFGDLVVACAACHASRPDGLGIEPE